MELKRWIVIEMRWKRKLGSWLSPEIDIILRPSSEKKRKRSMTDSTSQVSLLRSVETGDLSVPDVIIIIIIIKRKD